MTTGSSITQTSRKVSDIEKKSAKDLGKENIYFNVSKIYLELDAFTFESRIHVMLGNYFEMKIVEQWQKKYSFKDISLSIKDFKKMVKELYKGAIISLNQHIEHSKNQMPEVVIQPNVLKNFLLSDNYKDLYKSCFPE